jgi:hypothetical protein
VLRVQEAYGDLICAVATHCPELVPARRYITAASVQALEQRASGSRGGGRGGGGAAMHQLLRILGGSCHLTTANFDEVLNLVSWALGAPCTNAHSSRILQLRALALKSCCSTSCQYIWVAKFA